MHFYTTDSQSCIQVDLTFEIFIVLHFLPLLILTDLDGASYDRVVTMNQLCTRETASMELAELAVDGDVEVTEPFSTTVASVPEFDSFDFTTTLFELNLPPAFVIDIIRVSTRAARPVGRKSSKVGENGLRTTRNLWTMAWETVFSRLLRSFRQ